jgi:hypothetical protein
MIIDTEASRDVFNVIELSTLTRWEPEQDLSPDTTKLVPSARTVEERSRGIFIEKLEDLQHVLDHYAAAHQAKLGVGLKDGERSYELDSKPLATSLQEPPRSTPAQPALRAVVRCSQVPRWGQTK